MSSPLGLKRSSSAALSLGCLATLLLACGAAAGTAGSGQEGPAPARRVISVTDVPDDPYRLQPGDQLEIFFWGRFESTLKAEIRSDGTVPYPPIEHLQVAGLSLEELNQEIQKHLDLAASPGGEPEPEGPPVSGEVISAQEAMNHIYRLQPGDQLAISVWDHGGLNQKAQVREDGVFTFPLIGSVEAGGRTLPEVEKEISERLNRDYIVNPQVSVRLIDAQFSVLGQKGESGSHPVEGTVDLLTAISKAGDIATLRSSRVEVIRRQGDTQVVIRANVDRILIGKDPNIPVLPRDTIYVMDPLTESGQVSVRLTGAKFTILGEVAAPGAQEIEGPMDLLTAISIAGGVSKFGSNRIEVIRTLRAGTVVIRANLDRLLQGKDPNIPIHPRDTIYVRRRLF